jgi:hypothetical protein
MEALMKKNALVLGVLALLAAPMAGCADVEPESGDSEVGSTAQAVEPTPSDVFIIDIKNIGTGCPTAADTATTIAEDRKSFIVAYNNLGLGMAPAPLVKNINCNSSINLHVPQGFQVSIASITTRGYAYLPVNVRARETTNYFFAGAPLTFSPHSDLVGPFDGDFQFDDVVPFASVIWSACGASAIFGVNVQLNLNATQNPSVLDPTKPPAYFAAYSTSGHFEKVFHIQWRPCT